MDDNKVSHFPNVWKDLHKIYETAISMDCMLVASRQQTRIEEYFITLDNFIRSSETSRISESIIKSTHFGGWENISIGFTYFDW